MAKTHQMAVYALRLAPARARERTTFERGGTFDAFALLERYFAYRGRRLLHMRHNHENEQAQRREQRVLKYRQPTIDRPQAFISGLVGYGETGAKRNIYDTTSRKVTHRQGKDEAGLASFYFRLYVPDGSDAAVFAVQKSGNSSPKGAMMLDVKRYFRGESITAETHGVSHRDQLLAYLAGGRVQQVHVYGIKRPNDNRGLMDQTSFGGQPLQAGTDVQIVVSGGSLMERLASLFSDRFNRNVPAADLVRIAGLEEPEDVKITVEMNGRKRTMSVLRPDDAAMTYELEETMVGPDGTPNVPALDVFSAELCADVHAKLPPA